MEIIEPSASMEKSAKMWKKKSVIINQSTSIFPTKAHQIERKKWKKENRKRKTISSAHGYTPPTMKIEKKRNWNKWRPAHRNIENGYRYSNEENRNTKLPRRRKCFLKCLKASSKKKKKYRISYENQLAMAKWRTAEKHLTPLGMRREAEK